MPNANKTDSTTKMAPKDINQDGLAKKINNAQMIQRWI